MITIDHDKALELLREAVAERGDDFVYEPPGDVDDACKYTHETDDGDERVAGCGVGLALQKGGVPLGALTELDDTGGVITSPTCQLTLSIAGFELTERALRVLRAFQLHQDQNRTWKDALDCAGQVHAANLVCAHRFYH